MTFNDFISRFEKQTKTAKGVLVRCPAHEDGKASLQIGQASDGKILLHCFAGCETIDVLCALHLTMKDLFPNEPARKFIVPPPMKTEKPESKEPSVIDKIYPYRNALGVEQYQAIRMKPKSFRQRHKAENGEWVWNMDGVERVLYRLPEIQKSQRVIVVEGEKDVENLVAIGFEATCNVGGAGKWLDGYTETLAGKDVVLCGDNDEPGRKHMEKVFESICGHAKSVKIIKMPEGIKDASDWIQKFDTAKEAKADFDNLIDAAHPFYKGLKLPIYSISELEKGYQNLVNAAEENTFDLGKWLPSLGRSIRPLICGELVFIIGNTGTGKTALLSEIARAARPLPTLLFELELPPELLFERTLAAGFKMRCTDVEAAYKTGESLGEGLDTKFKNYFVCTEGRLTLRNLEGYIVRSELRIGQKPKLVLVDYIQLVQSEGVNRREKTSDIAEGLKDLAKATKTIIIVTSQIRRPDDEDPEVGLHDGKESGSIESSCGLLIGAWRDQKDKTLLHLKVLKSTKGGGGTHIGCNFDGERMIISERSQISDEDVPRQPHKD